MSEDNYETGRIKLMFTAKDKNELDTYLQELCEKNGVTEKADGYSWREMFYEEVSRPDWRKPPKFMLLENSVFEVLEYEDYEDHYHTKVIPEGSGVFTFSSCYYNGGASLEETLESEFKSKSFFDLPTD